MRRPLIPRHWLFLVAPCLLVVGCVSVPIRILSLIGLSQKPLVIMHVAEKNTGQPESVAQFFDPFAPYRSLREALGQAVGRAVVPELCFEFQLEPALRLGTSHLAIVSPAHYANLNAREDFRIVAVPVDRSGQAARPALLVVARDSDIQTIEDLARHKVAFGPARHPRSHLAALALLNQHGLKNTDLALEALPIPGSLRHIAKPREVALSVMHGSADAGFIDAQGWDRFPATSGSADTPSHEKFRVIGETASVPNRLIIASPKMQDATFAAVRDFLLTIGGEHPEAVEPLDVSAYEAADAEQVARWLEVVTLAADRAPASAQARSEP
jgi:ABC-type phosphate/phosphonate transport system substrate-binding protein